MDGECGGWLRRTYSADKHTGDTIIVPLDAEHIRAPLRQAVNTIFLQFGGFTFGDSTVARRGVSGTLTSLGY